MTSDQDSLPSATREWRHVASLGAAVRQVLERGEDLRCSATETLAACGLELSSERVRVSADALAALLTLARSRQVDRHRDAMFDGEIVNASERRRALHVALRAPNPGRHHAEAGRQVRKARDRVRALAQALHAGEMRGSTGEPITDIVNIGIGGSDFGSRLLCDALGDAAPSQLRVHFVSGVDALQIERLCRSLDPQRAVFIVSSKSFGTIETLINARTLLDWFAGRALNVSDHWFAVTGNARAAEGLGIPGENVLDVPDWVGGRFSAWGAVGLPAALYLGWPIYDAWVAGGAAMDEHHRHAPLEDNLPVRLALLNVWHSTFLDCPSHCIVSYDNRLAEFLTWAQQLEMESNGKSVTAEGTRVDYPTAPIVWGGLGNNGQHTYYQLLREGTRRNAVTLISVDTAAGGYPEHATSLARQATAQLEALASRDGGAGFNSVTHLHITDLTPYSLGALMAAFEHATTVSAWIWGLNPFDQPGVELGKKLATQATGSR